MRAVLCMRMIMNAAGAVIPYMRDHDQNNGRCQEPGFVSDEKLFGDQKRRSDVKHEQGLKTMVVFFVSMP